ncbi:tRNA threonylcarbamoyladenosine dehydratase [Clostridium fallax]|uniref:tRNA A37 threonylcarbamoyladenosine dehydratase n=1 Tax=Clostridium fallax TaxID=1533 RepID=A0A1M4W5K5_9CLOT|nr:tRNA threonylcarbamoyladenosine dehydratase [Clostridium fallax]SHE76554.1 tRNA A37 threonylcarbamoyladenosine dehydratase [Clostridium fallax]SQB22896.1 thiF domain protein [Clostridium fallax]
MEKNMYTRTQLVIGKSGVDILKNSKVIVFGIGGVGGFTVESLCRAGVGNLVIVDNDTVDITNLNRQIIATVYTIGKSKVEVMKERILSINPNCNVTALETFVTEENIKDIITDDVDYVVDAIDTISSKLALAEYCYKNNISIISSMGTGNKMDPSRFKVVDVFKTSVCPLAKVMRYELKKRGIKKLKVVYSDELPMKPKLQEFAKEGETEEQVLRKFTTKRQVPASIAFVPPVAGMIIASQVVKDLVEEVL